ncbi:MAG: hypothetical protein CVV27_18680 [Candidatus Melainabacteria bacterium HGW-Melainabacteria-1]|nr:MAG: hypothetical protein CVV27_18680 [Candidatus Melainabacteria bacterium HGW-Melainabacteria-1]
MAKAKPEKSLNDTTFKYVIDQQELDAAKKQVIKAAGSAPVVFLEIPLPNGQVELTVLAASLTPRQQDSLADLAKDGNLVKRIAQSEFAVTEVSFNLERKEP